MKNQKKNICFVVYDVSDMGGTNQVASSLSNALADKYNVSLFSITKSFDDIAHDFKSELNIFVCLKSVKSLKKSLFSCFWPALRYFKKNKIDVAFLIGHYPGFLLSVLQPFCRTGFVFCDHGALMNQWDDRDARLMRRIASMFCRKTVTLTEKNRCDYIKHFKTDKDKVLCIHNWIEYNEEDNIYNVDCKKIMSAGRFGKEKGYDMLIEVAKKVLPSHHDWQWDIYGDGDAFCEVLEKIKETGLSDQLKLMGRSNRLEELYKDYAMFALTSYREGLPLVLLEAKANNLPVVAFDVVTGPAEIINDGVDGFLIPEKRTDIMAEKLGKLMDDESLRKKFAENTKSNLEKFSVKEIFNKWVDLIDKM